MAERTVAVITDSACGIDPHLAADFGVYVVPVRVVIGDEIFADGTLSEADVLARMESGASVRTEEPHVQALSSAFTDCANAGASAIVAVMVGSSLSKTVIATQTAARTSPIPVTVVDTGTTSMAQGYAALAAGATSILGGTADEVAAAAQSVADGSVSYFTVDTLESLRRGGRMSGAVAAFGTLLKMRPVIKVGRNTQEVADRVRKTENARRTVRELVEKAASGMARPAAAVGLAGSDPLSQGLGIAVNGPTMVSRPPTSLVINSGEGMYNATVADMPEAFHTVYAQVSR